MKTKKAKWLLGLCTVMLGSAGLVRAQHDDNNMDGMDRAANAVANAGASVDAMDTRTRNAQMLIQTLSEEKTEINTLAAQQAMFRRMGGRENTRLARLWGQWIREHKAGGPTLMRLIRQNGGDPMQARILKAPVLGTQERMLDATHKDHEMAVMTSQMRHGMTNSGAIKRAMRKRANLARKHIRQMAPYHDNHHEMRQDEKIAVQG